MQDKDTSEILMEVKSSIPKNTKVYFVGGAIRNALFYKFFKEKLPQRNYDLVLIGDIKKFVKNLRARGFIYSRIKRKNQSVLKKKKTSKPKHKYNDYVILDIYTPKERTILRTLKNNSNFTINGSALSLKHIDKENWYNKVISLPTAFQDLKDRKLRVNVVASPSNLFACIRFMSKGFKPPSKKEIQELLTAFTSIEKWRYRRNIKKLLDYVGGEKEVKKLTRKLGIKNNILDLETIRKLHIKN